MAKKNLYITTIGFNKEDPDHVYVADLDEETINDIMQSLNMFK